MTSRNSHVLLIDDHACHAKAFEAALLAAGDGPWSFVWVRTLSSGLEAAGAEEVRAIFLNLFLPDSQGADTLDRLLLVSSTAPIIVIAGVDDEDICKTAMLQGARDYLLEGHLGNL